MSLDNHKIFKTGIENAIKMQSVMFNEASYLLVHKLIANAEFIRYSILRNYPENTQYLSHTNILAR